MSEHNKCGTKDAVQNMPRNQALVLDVLSKSGTALSAYAILDHVKPAGIRAPLQVYRALDKLMESGLVHRVESLNAFMACQQSQCETEAAIAFAICDACGDVAELNDEKLARRVLDLAQSRDFRLMHPTIELRGICEACR